MVSKLLRFDVPFCRTGTVRGRGGFTLIELLVVIAIISILMAMYMSTLHEVLGKVKTLAVGEGVRQEHVGRLADRANIVSSPRANAPGRGECRTAYRQSIETAVGPAYFTEVLYVVEDEAAFRAYWHTLIRAAATEPLEYDGGGRLIARDAEGNEFRLGAIDGDFWDVARRYGSVPVRWEFLSTNLKDTTVHSLGMNVVYADGHVEYIPYRRAFPSVPTVARLSQRFLLESQ